MTPHTPTPDHGHVYDGTCNNCISVQTHRNKVSVSAWSESQVSCGLQMSPYAARRVAALLLAQADLLDGNPEPMIAALEKAQADAEARQ